MLPHSRHDSTVQWISELIYVKRNIKKMGKKNSNKTPQNPTTHTKKDYYFEHLGVLILFLALCAVSLCHQGRENGNMVVFNQC